MDREERLSDIRQPESQIRQTDQYPSRFVNAWSMRSFAAVPPFLQVSQLTRPCKGAQHSAWWTCIASRPATLLRPLSTATKSQQEVHPRKLVKEEQKRKRRDKRQGIENGEKAVQDSKDKDKVPWRLTVGLEIHAQLNTARKLFSGVSQRRIKRSGSDSK